MKINKAIPDSKITWITILGVSAIATILLTCLINYLFSNYSSSHATFAHRETKAEPGLATARMPAGISQEPTSPGEFNFPDNPESLRQWLRVVALNRMEELLAQSELLSNPKQDEIREAIFAVWAERDLTGLANWFSRQDTEGDEYSGSREVLMKALLESGPEKGLAFMAMEKSLPNSEQNDLYEVLFRQWGGSAPDAAGLKLTALLSEQPENADLWNGLIGPVSAQWAKTNLYGALGWILTLPAGDARSQAVIAVSNEWADSNPQAAMGYVVSQKDEMALQLVTSKWAAQDPSATAAYISQLPAGPLHDAAVSSLISSWGDKDPQAAATYAANLPPGEGKNNALIIAASSLIHSNPEQAAQWIQQFPEGDARDHALTQLMSNWAEQNPSDAGQWALTVNDSSIRDTAINAFSNSIAMDDPEMAFQWATSILDETVRNQRSAEIAQYWLKQDPVDAPGQISQSTLPVAIKQELLSATTQLSAFSK